MTTRLSIEELLKLATPGPWMQSHHVGEPYGIVAQDAPTVSLLALDMDGMAIFFSEHDAALTVELRNAVEGLLARLAAAERVASCARAYEVAVERKTLADNETARVAREKLYTHYPAVVYAAEDEHAAATSDLRITREDMLSALTALDTLPVRRDAQDDDRG